jgi:exodeoxyribonuclease VII large subunit
VGERLESSRQKPLGIAEVVRHAGRTIDSLGILWLEGEVTQVTRPASGHYYFALRDRDCVLSAIMWGRDAARMKFSLEAGQRLRVRGRLGVYDRDGKMQLYADFAEPAGAGAEALALEQLKAKLAAEGMFSPDKKRPLPRFPRRIGVVTSRTGAAIHDIIRTIQRRLPTPILIADCAVQGPTAPAQIVNGLAMVVRAGVDVIIVGRGGGAVTDLTAFNHERVVRTISRCPVPVISAVGHEVDLSLADLAADARASTPTAAAELAVVDGHALFEVLTKERRRLDREIHHRLDRSRQDLDRATFALHGRGERTLAGTRHQLNDLQRRLACLHPRARILARGAELAELTAKLMAAQPGGRIARGRRDHEALIARTHRAMQRILDARRAELGRVGAQIAALSPLAVLDRGYAMVQRGDEIVRSRSPSIRHRRIRRESREDTEPREADPQAPADAAATHADRGR